MASTRLARLLAVLTVAVAACAAPDPEQSLSPTTAALPAADMLRGRDLYQTHCIACHTAKVHWRDNSVVRSWGDLRSQVTRFQRIAGQEWSVQEIDDVAAYLNDVFYKMPCPLPGCGGPAGGLGDGGNLAHGS